MLFLYTKGNTGPPEYRNTETHTHILPASLPFLPAPANAGVCSAQPFCAYSAESTDASFEPKKPLCIPVAESKGTFQ